MRANVGARRPGARGCRSDAAGAPIERSRTDPPNAWWRSSQGSQGTAGPIPAGGRSRPHPRRRDILCQAGGFTAVSDSICEDVTLGRLLVSRGVALGFFEAPGLVSVRMYQGWRATLRNWPRSLPMRDRYFGISGALGLLEVLLVQALPLPLFVALRSRRSSGWPVAVNLALALTRLGVLAGTARAYPARPWSYWLSPLADLPAALALVVSALRRRHVWRGRAVTRGTRPGGRS